MRKKIYLATIINNGKVSTMLVDGYSKPSVRKKLTDFFMKNNEIEDFNKFDIYLKRVIENGGEYYDAE